MQRGTFLTDANRGEERFRIQKLLTEGKSYQIALAEDVLMDDKLVCVKAIAYDQRRMNDKKYVGQRRKALHNELKLLSEPFHLLPDPLDWIQLPQSDTALDREPVLVREYIHGETLYDFVKEKFPGGMNPLRALRIAHEIADFLRELHEKNYVFRDLDPRHIIISLDDIIHVIGSGNAVQMGERINESKPETNEAYTAPEVRNDLSGKLLRPSVDTYALGALLSFLVTGEEPRSSTENPFTKSAYKKLVALEPKGIALLIARCMRPMAKERVGRMERLLPMLDPDNLPDPQSKGFGLTQLPAPWDGAEKDNRAVRSTLSAGPLISLDNEPAQGGKQPETALTKPKETRPAKTTAAQPKLWLIPIVMLILFAIMGVVSIVIL